MNRILMVEDDTELAELVADYLVQHRFEVQIESDGEAAVERILNDQPDLLLLDIMLPGADGMEIVRRIRPRYEKPIMMLTARTDQVDQIIGLELGADDYILKPVEPRLLLARIKVLLRRSPQSQNAVPEGIQIDELLIEEGSRSARVGDVEVDLTNPEFELLLYLAKRAGKVIGRQELFQNLKGIAYDGQNRVIDITVSSLRAKLNQHSKKKNQIIMTVRNKGYVLLHGPGKS